MLNKSMNIIKNEGFFYFLRRLLKFIMENTILYRNYNVYRKALNFRDKTNKISPVSNLELFVIPTSSELNKLLCEGYDFVHYRGSDEIGTQIEKGGILFCVFVNKKWAHTSWASVKNGSYIDPLIENIRNRDEVCIGNCITNPQFRGLGLYPYVLEKICDFFSESEYSFALISSKDTNIPSQVGISKAGFSLYSRGYNFILLGYNIWRQRDNKN